MAESARRRAIKKKPKLPMCFGSQGPVGIKNIHYSERKGTHIRHRLVVMTINVDSLLSNKEILELPVNDRDIRVSVVVGANVTESKLPIVKMANYAITNKSCR